MKSPLQVGKTSCFGGFYSTLWAVHPCTQGFELILGSYYLLQTQKTSFFPLFLVSWGRNNNFTTTQSSILWRWDHGTSKPEEKVGSPCFFLSCRGSSLQNGVKMGFFRTPPTCSCYVFLHHFPSFIILVRLLFQLLYIFHKCNTVI